VPAAGLSRLVRLIKKTVRAAVQPEAPSQPDAGGDGRSESKTALAHQPRRPAARI
jgi:hypothetical protein